VSEAILKKHCWRRWLISISVPLGAILLLGSLFGPMVGFVTAVVGIIWVAWRHDNDMGACLPLVVLLLIVAGVLMLLMYLMIVVHQS
jgi:hypothetical protein